MARFKKVPDEDDDSFKLFNGDWELHTSPANVLTCNEDTSKAKIVLFAFFPIDNARVICRDMTDLSIGDGGSSRIRLRHEHVDFKENLIIRREPAFDLDDGISGQRSRVIL